MSFAPEPQPPLPDRTPDRLAGPARALLPAAGGTPAAAPSVRRGSAPATGTVWPGQSAAARRPLPHRPRRRQRHQLRAVGGRRRGRRAVPVRPARHARPATAHRADPRDLARLPARRLPRQRYGYRVHGRWDPWTGARWNPAKLLLDPYARAVDGDFTLPPEVYGHVARLAAAAPRRHRPRRPRLGAPRAQGRRGRRPDDDWDDDHRPKTPWPDSVLYELHVRGFTMRHPGIPHRCAAPTPGSRTPPPSTTSPGSASPPSSCCRSTSSPHEDHLLRRGLRNYWGYNSVGYFAPHAGYAAGGTRGQQVGEFKRMVRALHDAGIEVILDVVYNHTAEAGERGPTLSLRGIDNRALLPAGRRRPPLRRLHRLRQHPARRPAAGAAADHRLAALLGAPRWASTASASTWPRRWPAPCTTSTCSPRSSR